MNDFGILPKFTGVAVHDHRKAYYKYENCRHSLCSAHILRELKFFTEQYKYMWSRRMSALLTEIKNTVDESRYNAVSVLPDSFLTAAELLYDNIVDVGFSEISSDCFIQSDRKAYNLIKRLRDFKENVLYSAYDTDVPFDSNDGERDIRMEKVKEKISGTIRGHDKGMHQSRIRSCIKTAQKNSMNILQCIKKAYAGNPFIPIQN